MSGVYDTMIGVFGDGSAMMLALVVFLAAAVMAFGVMATVHARGAVKRRTAGIAELDEPTIRARCAPRASRPCSACSTTPPSTIRRAKKTKAT